MAATILINRLTGAGPTATDITSATTRASTSDAPSPGVNDPIPIPGAGTNYSYWVTTRLECTVAPSGTVDNLRWFTDGANGFGTGVSCNGQSATSYVQATGTQGTTGTELTQGNHAGLSAAPVNVFTLTSASPKALAGSQTGTGQFGDRFVFQFAVGTTAGPGATPVEQMQYRYDET
jgi:hypothetical protein